MLSKEENLTQFTPTHFDYIIIDETHRAGASSYLKNLKLLSATIFIRYDSDTRTHRRL